MSSALVILCITFLVYTISFAVLLFVTIKSDAYLPFKAKQIDAVWVAMLSLLLWCVYTLISMKIIPHASGVQWCSFIFIWLQLIFGCSLFCLVLSYRMLRLYYILVLSQKPKGVSFYTFLFSQMLPIFSLAAFNQIYSGKYITYTDKCRIESQEFKIALYSTILFQLTTLFVINCKISKITSSFNEFKENQQTIIFFVLLLTVNMISKLIFNNSLYEWISQLLVTTAFILTTFGKVLYCYFYRKEEYLIEFKAGLSGLPKALKYGEKTVIRV